MILTASTPSKRRVADLRQRHNTAWCDGFDAGAAGMPVSWNPAPTGNIEAWSWYSGFIEGQEQRRITKGKEKKHGNGRDRVESRPPLTANISAGTFRAGIHSRLSVVTVAPDKCGEQKKWYFNDGYGLGC